MTLYKNVNGVDVALSQAEEEEFNQRQTEWEAQTSSRFQAQFTTQLMAHLDTKAKERRYDSALSCASYISSSNMTWRNEAHAFVMWRDAILDAGYNYQTTVQNGRFEDFLLTAPALVWP